MINFIHRAVPVDEERNMIAASMAANTPHRHRLSIGDQAKRGAMNRREFALPESLLPDDIGRVRLIGGPHDIPAAVGVRSIITLQEAAMSMKLVTDHWQLVLEPYDPNLLKRSLARVKQIGPTDPPPAFGLGEPLPATSDITDMMQLAHKELSRLRPHYEGTMLLVVFWQDRDGLPHFDFVATSLDGLRQKRMRALRHNERVKASSAPFPWPIHMPTWLPPWMGAGVQIWGEGNYIDAPMIPPTDEWVSGNKDALTKIVDRHFKPALWSLWKATFAEPEVAAKLASQGYRLEESDRTRMGGEELRELMDYRSADPANLTVMGDLSMLEELAADAIKPLT